MKTMVRFTAFLVGLLVSQLCLAQAPAGAPAGATGLCKDGTYTTAQSKQGACRGHQGVKTWFAAAAAAPAKTPAAKKSAPAPAATGAATSARSTGQAPAAPAPAGATGLCKDGTYTTAQSKQGACRGHQGVKTWFAAAAATPAPAPAKTPAAKSAPAPSPAQTQAPTPARPAAQPPAAPAPAGATGLCKDGTYTTAQSKQGACRGHQGVKTWFAALAATPAPAPAKTPAAKSAPAPAPAQTQAPSPTRPAAQPPAAPAPASKTAADTAAPAPGGGPDQVWLNTATNVYHCLGSRWYGKTKSGAYMTEAEAQAKGARANRGKPCR